MLMLTLTIKELLSIVSQHLKELADIFVHYFTEHENSPHGNLWINNPFVKDVETSNLNFHEIKSLIESCCDFTSQSRYIKESLSQFWISHENEYSCPIQRAIKLLVVFSTSYSCEKSFSSQALLETKERNRLDVEVELRVSETSSTPRLPRIPAAKQQPISHQY